MKKNALLLALLVFAECFLIGITYAQTNFINGDLLPDAPELATRGKYSIESKP